MHGMHVLHTYLRAVHVHRGSCDAVTPQQLHAVAGGRSNHRASMHAESQVARRRDGGTGSSTPAGPAVRALGFALLCRFLLLATIALCFFSRLPV
jgi:hypothetical protein